MALFTDNMAVMLRISSEHLYLNSYGENNIIYKSWYGNYFYDTCRAQFLSNCQNMFSGCKVMVFWKSHSSDFSNEQNRNLRSTIAGNLTHPMIVLIFVKLFNTTSSYIPKLKFCTHFSEARIIFDSIGSTGNSAIRRPSFINSPEIQIVMVKWINRMN